ncbi:LysR family transcriptional regulator [Marinicrinis sediminis]|uniref:LysR family transcriptional regulator n=1 Tax=Marinicrinis sediminis TaxID=1652465 RepID=A0ABW5R8M1_9BACL
MELRQLQYFVKVAKKQHMTQAAEELHIAQSAVSRQIHQLEEQLGVHLFLQQGRNLQLTPVGKVFLDRVEGILQDLDRVIQETREFIDPDLGEIRLGFPHSMGVHLVPMIVSQFRNAHPNVTFKLKQGKYDQLMQAVLKAEIDLAFISPFPEAHSHLIGNVLLTEELFAVVPPNHPLAARDCISLTDLQEESFVLFREGFSLRNIVVEACQKAGFVPKIGFESEETDTIRSLVAAGMGISLLPEMSLKYSCTPLQPVKLRITDQHVTRTIGIIHRTQDKLPLVAKGFKDFTVSYMKDVEI